MKDCFLIILAAIAIKTTASLGGMTPSISNSVVESNQGPDSANNDASGVSMENNQSEHAKDIEEENFPVRHLSHSPKVNSSLLKALHSAHLLVPNKVKPQTDKTSKLARKLRLKRSDKRKRSRKNRMEVFKTNLEDAFSQINRGPHKHSMRKLKKHKKRKRRAAKKLMEKSRNEAPVNIYAGQYKKNFLNAGRFDMPDHLFVK